MWFFVMFGYTLDLYFVWVEALFRDLEKLRSYDVVNNVITDASVSRV